MQHDHALKKLNSVLLTPYPRVLGDGSLRAKYLLPCCCIHDSFKFNLQHDHVLKKLTIDLLTCQRHVGSAGKIFATMLLHFVIPFNLYFVFYATQPCSEKVEF